VPLAPHMQARQAVNLPGLFIQRPDRPDPAMNPRLATSALALLIALSGSVRAQADTPQARAQVAQELVQAMDSLMGPERMRSTLQASIRAPMEAQLRQASHLTVQQRDRAVTVLSEAMSAETSALLADVMPSLYAAMREIYVERFTLAELRELRQFYDSSAGRKSLTVMQDDMPRLMQPMVQMMQGRAPQLRQRIEAAVRQLQSESIELQAPKR